ncbi:MAG: efflux RND transporter periplasmic adaptor subunit [Bacteroidales bacterium]|nr:efflux RND transporter periplasmic adaptor subunit [Bacteroidales bacterium]
MKKVLKTCGWVLVGAFVIYTFYFLWKQSQPVPVVHEVVAPVQRDIVKKIVATGALEARTQVELKPQITGVVTELRVEAGKEVHAGDVVAIIRVIPDMSQLTKAQSEVEAATISLEEVAREAERSQELYDKGVISREENEQQQNRLAVAKDKVAAAKALVEVITRGSSSRAGSVNTTEVHSTMNGIVLNVPVKVGTSVSGSSSFSQGTTIATVADMSDIIFRGNIDETEVAKLHTGMEVTLVPASMQKVNIPAVLDYISPEGTLQNGAKMFELKATASVPEGVVVRSGYSVNANITIAKAPNALSVDETCVEFEGDNAFVYRLTSSEADVNNQQWERVPVQLGVSDGIHVEVKSGISKEDKLRGIQK